jgi:hypothetical protein
LAIDMDAAKLKAATTYNAQLIILMTNRSNSGRALEGVRSIGWNCRTARPF